MEKSLIKKFEALKRALAVNHGLVKAEIFDKSKDDTVIPEDPKGWRWWKYLHRRADSEGIKIFRVKNRVYYSKVK